MSFWRTKIVKVRKKHRCAFCNTVIKIGDKAEYNCGTYEGEFQSYYFCNFCYVVAQEVNNLELEDGFNSDEIDSLIDILCKKSDCEYGDTIKSRMYRKKIYTQEQLLELECDCGNEIKLHVDEFIKICNQNN